MKWSKQAEGEPFDLQYVYPPDRGRELLVPTRKNLVTGFRNAENNGKVSGKVRNACSKAYSMIESGYYLDAEIYFSQITSQISTTLGLFLTRGTILFMLSDFPGAKTILERGLLLSKKQGDTRLESAFCVNLGQLYSDLSQPALAGEMLDTAISISKSEGHLALLLAAFRQKALLNLFLGFPKESESQVRSGIEIANREGRHRELCSLHYVLGTLRIATGDLQSAEHHLVRCTETGTSQRRGQVSRAWFQIALVKLLLGNPDGARNAVEKSLETANQEGGILNVARAIGLACTLEVATGAKLPDAALFDQAIEMERRSGYRFGIIRHQLILAKLCLQHQDVQSALILCLAAGSLANEIGHEVSKIEIRGLSALVKEDTPDGCVFQTLEECIESCRIAGIPLQEAEMHQLMGSAYVSSGLLTEAWRCFVAAAELSRRIGARLEEAKALGRLAQVQEMQGEKDKASESAATAQAIIQSMGIGLSSVTGP